MTEFVSFDRDWHAIGFIEPEFVEETYGWANEQILVDAGMIAVRTYASAEAACWVGPDTAVDRIVPLPEPKRLVKTVLKWCWVGPSKFMGLHVIRPLPAIKSAPRY